MAVILNAIFYVEAKTATDNYSLGDFNSPATYTITDGDGLAKEQEPLGDTLRGGPVGSSDNPRACFIVSDKAITVLWYSDSGVGADSSSVVLLANEPFFLPSGKTLPYETTVAARAVGTEANIADIQFYNSSGSTAVVRSYLITADAG